MCKSDDTCPINFRAYYEEQIFVKAMYVYPQALSNGNAITMNNKILYVE